MNCPSCHYENRDGRKFCVDCGAALALQCPACGAAYEAGETFCGECGAEIKRLAASGLGLGESDNATLAANRLTANRLAYTPKHLGDKILQSKSALEGERKQVTMLFADVKGSMELAEHLDPEEWHHILDRFFQILTEGVHRFKGTVNQYTRGLVVARECGSKIYELQNVVALARAEVALGHDDAVDPLLMRAEALITDMGALAFRPHLAEIRAARHQRGDQATRRAQLAEAQRLFTETGATGHAARVARALREQET
jgi:class 3 adenylate cyclase